MRDFASEYSQMTPDMVGARVRDFQQNLSPERSSDRSADEIENIFDLMHGYMALNQHAEAGEVFRQLKPAIDDFRERQGSDEAVREQALDFLIEWSLMALQFTPERSDDFVCMPIYRELFEAIEQGPEKMRYRGVQARAQLERHYTYWLGNAGDEDALEDEDVAYLKGMMEGYEEALENALEACTARGDLATVVRLHRNASRYHLYNKRPNEGISALKEALEVMPETEGYHEADSADILMQLGSVFMSFKKYSASLRYFQQALEIYERGGEELEMFAFQAEGWIEEVERLM